MTMECVTYFVIFWPVLAKASTDGVFFSRDRRYDNELPLEGIHFSLQTSTKIQCALNCDYHTRCLSFFFDGTWCHGYSNRMHDLMSKNSIPSMCYYEMKGKFGNLAVGKTAEQSSILIKPQGRYTADKAVDGWRNPVALYPNDSCVHTLNGINGYEWWRVDLVDKFYVSQVALLARIENSAYQIGNVEISVAEFETGFYTSCDTTSTTGWLGKFETFTCNPPIFGRFVRLKKLVANFFSVCEVEVYANYK